MCDARRDHLESERLGFTHSFDIITPEKTYSFYLTCNIFDDGRLGEIFIRAGKMGSFISGVLHGFAINFSIALQHGVPLESLTTKMRYTKFDPAGMVRGAPLGMPGSDNQVMFAKSPFDYIAAYLEWKFPEGTLRADVVEQLPYPKELDPVELTPSPMTQKAPPDEDE